MSSKCCLTSWCHNYLHVNLSFEITKVMKLKFCTRCMTALSNSSWLGLHRWSHFSLIAIIFYYSVCNEALLLLQPFYGSLNFVRDNPGESVPEETFIHSHRDLSWSSIISYLLPPSCMIHGILLVQLTCLTVISTISLQVFFVLPLGLSPSTSYSIHFFPQSLSSS